jgi:hypothetical protein
MVEFSDDFSGDPWWWRHAPPVERSTRPPDQADVVVIGGGYAGLCSGRAGISKMIDLKAYVGHGKAAAILDEADEAFGTFG